MNLKQQTSHSFQTQISLKRFLKSSFNNYWILRLAIQTYTEIEFEMFSSPRSEHPEIGMKSVQEKYSAFVQHIQTFLQALSNSKNARAFNILYDPVVRTITQVKIYHDACNHAVEKRTLKMFLDTHQEVCRLRSIIEREVSAVDFRAPNSSFQELVNLMTEWEMMSDINFDFSEVRAKYPHREINHLSCVQAREQFGGAVCILPVLIDYATKSSKILQDIREQNLNHFGEMNEIGSQKNTPQVRESQNEDDYIKTNYEIQKPAVTLNEGQKSPKKRVPTNSKKRLQNFITNPDSSMRLVNGKVCSMCKMPENPNKSKKREDYSWEPTRVWRGASKGAINHVAHRYCACKGHKEAKGPDHLYHAPTIY